MKIWKLYLIAVVLLVEIGCEPKSNKTASSPETIAEPETIDREAIVIYGSNTCHHCTEFKSKLDSAGLTYEFNDVDISDEHALRMLELVKEAEFKGRILFPVVYVNEDTLFIAPKIQDVIAVL